MILGKTITKKLISDPKKNFSFGIFLIIFSLSFFNLVRYSTASTKVKKVRGVKIENNAQVDLWGQKLFWQSFLNSHPDYLPGWLELAKIEVQLENPAAASQALIKAREIDPNSPVLKEVGKKLGVSSF